MDRTLIKTSKFLSLVLRHHPDSIGLPLDANGWAQIDELLDAASRSGRGITREHLQRVVDENDKRRFEINDDGTKIRASQGHSIDIDLELQPCQPPDVLYHGTVQRFLKSIRQKGLIAGSRQHVHLSRDQHTASAVGQRRGKPVILTIRSGDMHRDGFSFYISANHVWLADEVPVRYIKFPE